MSDFKENNKGSEWRKWDLHIHTPASALNNQFAGTTIDDKWASYFEKLKTLTDISVLGITDYFSVEGYKKVKQHKEGSNLDNIDYLLPNIELRMLPVTDSNTPINLHIILNPQIIDRIDSLLFNNLEHQFNGRGYKCTREDLTALGRDYDSALIDDNAAYIEGVNQFKVTTSQIRDALNKNKDLEDGTIILVSNSSNDGNSGIQHSSLATTRQEIYRLSHAIFSANPEDRKHFLGQKDSDTADDIIGKYGHLMSCVHGSDAHSLGDICKPDLDRYTWIKADPTFEGLKQIIYEPESRVLIQQEKPESKIPYTVIDSVRFLDKRQAPDFSEDWIPLNQNLNSIIGGKSSGKSLLLYHIAKTIDAERIDNINAEPGTHNRIEYSLEGEDDFDFEIKWTDGASYKLKDSEKPDRPITYIPQLYLNRLAEDQKNELNKLVDKMLVESSEEYKLFRNKTKANLDSIKTEVFQVIDEYYKIKDSLEIKRKELKEIGDKKAIEENQKKIQKKIDILRKESSFSEEEETKYKELTETLVTLKKQESNANMLIAALEMAKVNLNSFKGDIGQFIDSAVLSSINAQYPTLPDEISDKISMIITKTTDSLQKALEIEIQNGFTSIPDEQKQLSELKNKITVTEKGLAPLAAKVKNKGVFEQSQKELEAETTKLKTINEKQLEIDKLTDSLTTEPIKEKYEELFLNYKNIVTENQKYESIPDTDNLKLKSTVKIDNESFEENFTRKINKKRSLGQQFGSLFDSENNYLYNETAHLDNAKTMIDKITLGETSFNTGFDEKHTLLSLLDDYFSIDYNLLQDGDDLIKMSPGKRGIILFQIFLHLSKSENPILIDQPEDNLDNRTVYQELNEFIKTKKSTRQIIIVSHNPNLVVSTDSENIIVANQDGQNKSGANDKFKFEYVNGAIENTFIDESKNGILFKRGIRQHVCDVLEGGEEAFEKREDKYGLKARN